MLWFRSDVHLIFVTRYRHRVAYRGHLPPGQQPYGSIFRRLRQEFPDLRAHYWQAKRLWSGSYFAGSAGGAPITVLRQYIEQHNRPS